MKRCPYCAEEIQDEAIVCRFCGRDLVPDAQLPMPPEARAASSSLGEAVRRNRTIAGGALIVGGLLVVVGSFLPWLSASAPLVGTVTRNGMEGGDGLITLVCGVAIGLIGLGVATSTLQSIFAAIPAAIAGFVVLINVPDLNDRTSEMRAASSMIAASIGAGVWTVAVGSIGSFVVALVGQKATPPSPIELTRSGEGSSSPLGSGYNVVLVSHGSSPPNRIIELVDDYVPGRALSVADIVEPPVIVASDVGYATGEGLRRDLVRLGAAAELVERTGREERVADAVNDHGDTPQGYDTPNREEARPDFIGK